MSTSTYLLNQQATNYVCEENSFLSPLAFHQQLPGFKRTPLAQLPKTLTSLDHVFIKDESQRLGLPSFKILGASWGTFRALIKTYDLSIDTDLQLLAELAQAKNTHLVTATDGNHGRAIARMARWLGVEATVFVPYTVNSYTRSKIGSEGAKVLVEFGDYDAAVESAYRYAKEFHNHIFIQDTSFENYREIPVWIVDGYATLLEEVEEQLEAQKLQATHVFTPFGVGSLTHAVVKHCKSEQRSIRVVAVEADAAPCFQVSLKAGEIVPISTSATIMDGVNCGTVSEVSWPDLKHGVDAAITVSDVESHVGLQTLASVGIQSGPCGAAPFAALQKISTMNETQDLGITEDSVIVLINTEGPREYDKPAI